MSPKSHWLLRYGVATAVMLVAFAIRWSLVPVMGLSIPFLTVFPALSLIAVTLGAGPGMFATILGVLLAEYYLVPPHGIELDLGFAIRMAIMLATAGYVGWVSERLHKARAQADSEAAAARSAEEALRKAHDELEDKVRERTAALAEANQALEGEVAERARREKMLQARLRLVEFAESHSLEQLLQKALDEAEALTGSSIGFYHFVEADERTLRLQMWSSNTLAKMCAAEGKGQHYDVSKAGVWADCVRQRKAVVHNDYAAMPNRQGLPAGHAPVVRELVVPVFRNDRIVAIVGVGNKPSDYHARDVEAVSFLGDLSWDISERKRAEEKLQQTLEELARSNKELEQFAYVASHDLQEPLRMVASYVQLLARRYQGKLDKDADEFIAFAVDGAARMQRLIEDLLTFSRVGTRGKPLEATDCAAVVKEALANLELVIHDSGAAVDCGPLPTVRADATQLLQLFQNLIDNAIKFRGDAPPRVHISAAENGNEWIFSVRDNGIGIDPQYFERIFIVFQRLHAGSKYRGTGIGLAVCKKIVERHGGRIWVESAPGKGTTFCFTMPKSAA